MQTRLRPAVAKFGPRGTVSLRTGDGELFFREERREDRANEDPNGVGVLLSDELLREDRPDHQIQEHDFSTSDIFLITISLEEKHFL